MQNSGRTDVEISYEITSGEDVAEIADNTLKIKKPGTVTVKATVKEDNTHFVATFSYDVEVTKGTRTGNLVFETPNPSDIKFGENDNKFTNVATYSSIVDERDSAIGYEIVNGEKIASVDANGVSLTVFYVEASSGGTVINIPNHQEYTISGDNMGGFIVAYH